MLVILVFTSVFMMTTLVNTNRTSMTNTYCVYTLLRYS